ncbi:hypothetical protein [Qipengyuania sp. ASV99]|uniref:hypothetical protein n=1 Tax=Qipengyuania sp. ASV99 TaxID=3399681 RepID=UPI003A4C56EC
MDAKMKRWLMWNFLAPLAGPLAVSMLFMLAWKLGEPEFEISIARWLDISPWALVTYTVTLIGSNFDDYFRAEKPFDSLVIQSGLCLLAIVVFGAFITIWAQDPDWKPTARIYIPTVILLVASVRVCYVMQKRVQGVD